MTHTLYDGHRGGKVRVERASKTTFGDDDGKSGQARFNELYATEVDRKTRLYVNELRQDKFKYFLDLDLVHDSDTIVEEDYDRLIATITTAVKRFFPSEADHLPHRFLCLLLRSPCKSSSLV